MKEKQFKVEKEGVELAHFFLTHESKGKFKVEINLGLFIKGGENKVNVSGYNLLIDAKDENEAINVVRGSLIRKAQMPNDIDITPF